MKKLDKDIKTKAIPRKLLYLLLALSTIAALQVFTGIADNSDFARSYAQFIAHALVLPEIGFSHWQNFWVINPNFSFLHPFPPGIFPSSYQLLLAAQVLLNKLIYSHGLYSMMTASLISRIIYLGLFFAICLELRKVLRGWLLIGAVIFLWLLFNDTGFVQFFNSFYQGQAGILFFLGLFYLVLRIPTKLNFSYLTGLAVLLALLTTAKMQYLISPIVIAFSLALSAFYFSKKMPYRKVLLIMAAFCLLIQIPMAYVQLKNAKNNTMAYAHMNIPVSRYDAYEAYYLGALTVLSKAELKQYAPNADPSCINVGAWQMKSIGSPNSCFSRTHSTYKDVISLYLHHPKVLLKALDQLRVQGTRIRINALGKTQAHSSNFNQWLIFNIWNKYISPLLRAFFYSILLMFLASAYYLRKFWLENPRWFIANVFLLSFSASQYIMTLADGFHEAAKHSLLANLAFMLAFIFISAFTILEWLRRKKEALAQKTA